MRVDSGRALARVLLVEHHVAAALELVALDDLGLVDLAVAARAPALLMQPGLALAVELVEAEDGVRAGGRENPHRHRHETDLEVALPGGACSHVDISRFAADTAGGTSILSVRSARQNRARRRDRRRRRPAPRPGLGARQEVRRPRWGYLARAAPSCPIASKPGKGSFRPGTGSEIANLAATGRSSHQSDVHPPGSSVSGGGRVCWLIDGGTKGFRRSARRGGSAARPAGRGGAGDGLARGSVGSASRCSRSRPASRTHERLLRRGDLVFERKYDGIRALIEVSPGAGAGDEPHVHIWSRLGNDKTEQFPRNRGRAGGARGGALPPDRAGRRDRRRRRGGRRVAVSASSAPHAPARRTRRGGARRRRLRRVRPDSGRRGGPAPAVLP